MPVAPTVPSLPELPPPPDKTTHDRFIRFMEAIKPFIPAPVSDAAARMRWASISAAGNAFAYIYHLLLSSPVTRPFIHRIRALPIADFYVYMWRTDPALLLNSMFVNYALPVLMEALPWYLSRRKISKILRESRNSISHRLVANEPFSDAAIGSFMGLSIVYALVQTIEQVLRTRVLLANRLLIKRLVLERILYSELGSLQEAYMQQFGEHVRTENLEAHVFNDIHETLNLFNNTLPSMLRGVVTLGVSGHELWQNRAAFDVLAILRPSVVGLMSECVNYVREKWIVDVQTIMQQRNASAMSRVVSNIVDGLAEIQINNMQQFQLQKLDAVSGAELENQQGVQTFVNNVYRQVSNRSVFDFASEVYVVRLVMNRRRIDHETYRKVQNDIDYVTRLFGRLWAMGRDGWRVLDTQNRVIALLNLPSFIKEEEMEAKIVVQDGVAKMTMVKRIRRADEDGKSSVPPPANSSAPMKGISLDSSPRSCVAPSTAADTSFTSSASFDTSTVPSAAAAATFDFHTLHFRRCRFRYKPNLPYALNIQPRSEGAMAVYDGTEQEQESPKEDEVEDDSYSPPPTSPTSLLKETEEALNFPRIPKHLLRRVPPPSSPRRARSSPSATPLRPSPDIPDDISPLSPLPSDRDRDHRHRHASHLHHSGVMEDMVHAADEPEDEDEDEDEEAGDGRDDADATVPIRHASHMGEEELRELEELITSAEHNETKIDFPTTTSPNAVSMDTSIRTCPRPAPSPLYAAVPLASAVPSPSPALSPSLPDSESYPPPRRSPSLCEPGTLLFERGKTYAIVGENRAGKSTVMQLLCKLYQPEGAGTDACDIRMNGEDFTAIPRMQLRHILSYVAQRPFIFPGTIEENIRIGNTHATAAEVEEAARMAGIFSMEKPKPLPSADGSGQGSLVDRTHSRMMVKPWEQNRLKNAVVATGTWLKDMWMRVHGFDKLSKWDEREIEEQVQELDVPHGDIKVKRDKDRSSHCPHSDAAAKQSESKHQDEQPSPGSPPSSTEAHSIDSQLPTSLAASSSTSDPSSLACSSVHPVLRMETAERGANLSGGFAQSVALARVFLRKEAQTVILDEAMGQMDSLKKRELIFPQLFDFVKKHRMTLIIISHDVPLVCKLVDQVYVLERGQVAQTGTHDELLEVKHGPYARLVGAQT